VCAPFQVRQDAAIVGVVAQLREKAGEQPTNGAGIAADDGDGVVVATPAKAAAAAAIGLAFYRRAAATFG
jgi:hypothetical protein